jgi:hypothetical protein
MGGLTRGAIAALALVWTTLGAAAATTSTTAPKICTWGGTPAATTGEFTVKPGVTNTPSDGPLKIVATGPLDGDCEGKAVFDGVMQAGATCAATVFEGKVKGIPGVDRLFGPGVGGVVHEFFFDKDGNVVGSDQPQVLSGITMGGSDVSDCNTPEGFTHGHFSSTIELFE